VACSHCQRLESEKELLERIHAEALGGLQANSETASTEDYNALRIAESNARLDLEIAVLELKRHKRNHQKAN
jgi:hypothetical protein